MNKKKIIIFSSVALILIIVLIFVIVFIKGSNGKMVEIKPHYDDIELFVSTFGTVKPQNRLEIKPPIGGRIERILVKEGQEVKIGEILAYMSSTERATLVDAARLKSKEEFKYWQKAYKETPLISPIDGVIIVRDVEPGQSVTTSSVVLVLSNRLIVEADVDETDIGEVKVGQKATIALDAYPEIKIDAVVDHISYESEIVNNVTIYKVDVLPVKIPEVFRSGMSANVEIIVSDIKNALLVPANSLIHENGKTMALIKESSTDEIKKVDIETGLRKDDYIQIISGLSDKDIILVPQSKKIIFEEKSGNPFMPKFRRDKKENK